MRRTLGLIGVAAAVSLVGVTAQAAAPVRTWHTGLVVTRSAQLTVGALAANGDAVASGDSYVQGRWRIEVATRHGFAAPWSVQQLTGALRGAANTTSAISDGGAAVVLWRAPGAGVQSAVRATRSGAWHTLAVPSGAAAVGSDGFFSPSASMTAKGAATIEWVAHEQNGWAVRSAFRSGTNAIWRATPPLFPTAPAGSNLVNVTVRGNAEGDAIATWTVVPNGSTTGTVYVALRAAHRAWGTPDAVGTMAYAPTYYMDAPVSVSIAPNGRVALAWDVDATTEPTMSHVVLATGDALTGHVSPPITIAAGVEPSIATNSTGALAAVWTVPTRYSTAADLKAAIAPDGVSWSTPTTLEPIEALSESDFGHAAMGESGRAFAYWAVDFGPGSVETEVESAAANGAWSGFGGAVDTDSITLAVDHSGDALALEASYTHDTWTVASSYDAVPRPVLAVTADGHWLAGRHSLRWTITVRNRGKATAGAVHLKVALYDSRVMRSSPKGHRTSASGLAWNIGAIRRGQSRTLTVVVARAGPKLSPVIDGYASATGIPTVTFVAFAPR
jgi:hypothetical protein